MVKRTVVILKPDIPRRRLIGEAILRIERKFKIIAMRMENLEAELVEEFYSEHMHKDFFLEYIRIMVSGPSILMCLEGENVINEFREFIGATDPAKAAEGTFRKEFGISLNENSVHGSASTKDSGREIGILFPELREEF